MNTRRSVLMLALSGLAAAGLLATNQPSWARPRIARAAAGLTVDVSRLTALGLGPTADIVRQVVASEFAGYAGTRAVIRVTGISFNAFAGSDGGRGRSGGANVDYIEGDLLILGPRGEVVSQHHQVSSSPASSGGPYYLPGSEQRRVEALARNFAGWLKRQAM